MHLILPKCTLFFRNAPDSRKNAPCFQKCTRLSKKCTPLFQKCTLKNQKCTRAFSLGAFFYQNRCTKPPLGYKKDMCPRNPGISTVPGFFHAHFYSGNKKICRSVGRDLNYRSPVLKAGFASFLQIPPFFVVLEM